MNKVSVKKLINRIAACVVFVIAAVGFGIGDWLCYYHEYEISYHLSPDTVVYDSAAATEALAASDAVVRAIADEGITLVKNNGALPLDPSDEDESYINMFGIGGTDKAVNGFYVFGRGSGSISQEKEKCIFPKEGLEAAGFQVNKNLYDYFVETGENPSVSWWESTKAKSLLNYAKAWSDTAVVFVSRFTGENAGEAAMVSDGFKTEFDMPWEVKYVDNDPDGRNSIQLSLKEEAMIKYCADNFSKTIVVVNCPYAIELGALDYDGVDAVLICPYTGQSGAAEIGRILAGDVNPSGHLADTFAYDVTANPSYANAFKITGTYGKQLAYVEDIYIGYKWYETADVTGYFESVNSSYDKQVWRPFGYGLSYTDFSWEVKSVSVKNGKNDPVIFASGGSLSEKKTTVSVTVEVKNTGNVPGKDVVQLYVTPPYENGGIEKPHVQLCAFGKTEMLYPINQSGADKPNSQALLLEFDLYDIASYDCYDKNKNEKACWELDGGKYTLSLRTDAHTVKDCKGANIDFNLPDDGFFWDTDPETGGEVKNRFTGATAEAGVPSDGNGEGNEKIVYLSRADFAGTFPTEQASARVFGADLTQNGIYDVTDKYENITRPTIGSTETQHLMFTLDDGSKATLADLNHTTGNTLTPNEELIMKLGSDYNAPEWEQLLKQFSTFEDMANIPARAGLQTSAAEDIGKPKHLMFDGPQGLTNSTLSFENLSNVSGFPAAVMVAMTWNTDLARQEGAAMGDEVSKQGVAGMYAPAVDVHRNALNGRNFETYSEDSLLAGHMAAKMVLGITSHGIQASVKHFAVTTTGNNPIDYNQWLTEQNLRENYMRAFEIAVKDGDANYIMTGHGNIGGVKCHYSYELLTNILRGEWGYKGSVITDYGVGDTSSLFRAGMDMKMKNTANNLKELDQNSDIDWYSVRRATKNVLYSYCNTYYRTKTYNPDYTISSIRVIPAFRWWIMLLVIIEVLAFAGLAFWVVWSWLPDRLKRSKARAAAGEVENAAQDKPSNKKRENKNAVAAEQTAPSVVPEQSDAASAPTNGAPEQSVMASEMNELRAEIAEIKADIAELKALLRESAKPQAKKPAAKRQTEKSEK